MADEFDGYDEAALKEMVSCGGGWWGDGRVALPLFLSSLAMFSKPTTYLHSHWPITPNNACSTIDTRAETQVYLISTKVPSYGGHCSWFEHEARRMYSLHP